MTALFLRVCGLSLAMGGFLLVLLAARRFLAKRYTARWRCWVWLLLAVRLLLPLQLTAPLAALHIQLPSVVAQPQYHPVATPGPQKSAPESGAAPGLEQPAEQKELLRPNGELQPILLPPVQPAPSLLQLATGLWLVGAALCLGAQWLRYGLWRRTVLRWNQPVQSPELLALLQTESRVAGLKQPPAVFLNPKITTPLVVGCLRPLLLLPEGFAPGPVAGPVLRHECIHLRRHDLLAKQLLLWAAAFNWFNPLVWLLRNIAQQDMELSCDEAVLAGQDKAQRLLYGYALLETAKTPRRNRPFTS